jgi:hypothetical protein
MIAGIFPLSNSKLRLKPFANEKAYAKFREAGVLMRKLLFLLCILGLPRALWAQSNPASWENLNMLQKGENIQVVEMNSKRVSGAFLNVSDAGVSLQEKAGQQIVQREDIRSVKLTRHQHRLRNTLIGAAIGAGAGAGIGTVGHRQGSLQNPNGTFIKPGQGAAIGAVLGLVGGAVVGALIPSHKTIYDAKVH